MNSTVFHRRGSIHVPKGFGPAAKNAEAREPFYSNIIKLVLVALRAQGINIYVEGAEKIPETGGALLTVNHTGYYDFILSGAVAHVNGGRLVRFMTKREIFDKPVIGWLMRKMQHIRVDRSAGAASMTDAVQALKDGKLVGIFPEGTISRSFEVQALKTGAVRIAQEAGTQIIPVTVWGSQRIWTKDLPKNLGRSHTPVWVRVGDPLKLVGDVEADTQRLHDIMQAQVSQLQRDYDEKFGPFPAGEPWMTHEMGGGAPTLERADLLALEEKERRQAARERKRASKLRRLDLRADRKAADVLASRGLLSRTKARIAGAIEARRER
ncbi:lysophospholipid acyltransferase family protein [Corynebacterium sp. H128]|uniref:lysophospholipid acyltransferase family protein n=1 Tax=unclassified Corynebacterium TaxID=2624378 RepID=UPI003099779B